MLRTALLKSSIAPSALRTSTSTLLIARQGFATHAARFAEAKRPQHVDTTGSEGVHFKDELPVATPYAGPGAKNGVTGDWVLFHPVYTPEELKAVKVINREPQTVSDRLARLFVTSLRKGFDITSRYKHKDLPPNHKSMSLEELRKGGYTMDEGQWLHRILFLESIAGVPGMVAAVIRHLRSLRLMKRDSGWIHTLLEEAENERMHLMTFMTLKQPTIWYRALILGAQGVFYNVFFLAYLFSPRLCHRFVACLEEEAVLTYTRAIEDIEGGRLPEWDNKKAPEIARDYWRLGDKATMLDVIYAVRTDESTHRFVNHSLANLQADKDANPFAIREPDMHIKGAKPGFTREEAAEYALKSEEMVRKGAEGKISPKA